MPTFASFVKVFMATYAKANNKPSEQASKKSILDNYLLPRYRTRRLDSFKVLDIDQLKAEMLDEGYNRKTINNAMAVWAKLLHYAQDQELIGKTPRFKFLKIREEKFDFFDFDELEHVECGVVVRVFEMCVAGWLRPARSAPQPVRGMTRRHRVCWPGRA